jgi:hypothetical protein
MHWVRSRIRSVSWFALLALAINIGLSFAHFHGIGDGDSRHRLVSQIAGVASPDRGQTQGHHDDDRVDLLCSICMAAHAMGHALGSAPPALPLALVESPIDLTIELDLTVPQPRRAAFDSRGPPIS